MNRINRTIRCSIIIPIYNQISLTRQCLDALWNTLPTNFTCEVIIVDDGSSDTSLQLLSHEYPEHVRVVSHLDNQGFAAACNSGALDATATYLVFLNNDSIPQPGWLTALVDYIESHPAAAAVGSKLLYPNDTIQHAGVAICQDRYPRHIYNGFPANHPAVNRSRRFQIVTAACMLIRRTLFEQVGGFDTSFRNGFEDVDLCLRLGELGYEIHYCHTSTLYHLESVSPGRFDHDRENVGIYHTRWLQRVQPDDLSYYIEDGLLTIQYSGLYPVKLSVSPFLAAIEGSEHEQHANRLLTVRSRQVFDLLKDNIALNLRMGQTDTRRKEKC